MEENLKCKCCKTWEEEIYWKHFNSMHFFLTLPPHFRDHLVLPEKFATHMKAFLPNKVPVKGPSGALWDIELLKSDDLLFVGDGWKDFVKVNELKENCVMVFKFKRNLSFEVLVFDQGTACEKESAYFVKKCRHITKSGREENKKRIAREASSTEVIETDGEENGCEDNKKRTATEASSTEVIETENEHSEEGLFTPEHGESFKAVNNSSKKLKPESAEKRPCSDEISKKVDQILEELTIIEKDEIFTAKEPHGKRENGKKVTRISRREVFRPDYKEISSEDNRWSLKSREKRGTPKKQVFPKSSKKNLIKSGGRRIPREYVSNRRPVTEMEKEEAFQRANQKQTENSFLEVMKPTSVYNKFYLDVPAEWMHKHLPCRNQEVILRVGEKTWKTTLFTYGNKGAGISTGWKKFSLDNFLEEFDVLLFKLADSKGEQSVILDVDIFRVIE